MADLTDRERYMYYEDNASTAIARKIKAVDKYAEAAYAAAAALRNYASNNASNADKAIEKNVSDAGDRLTEFSDDLKHVLFHRYQAQFSLEKAIDEEIVDGHDVFCGDHFEQWIAKQRKEPGSQEE